MEELIKKITDKKELRGIDKELTQNIIKEYKEENPKKYEIIKEKKYNTKSKEFQELKKYVRKKLRTLHGAFQKNIPSQKKKEDYLTKKDFSFQNNTTQKFLKSHRSTNERLNYYETLYNIIEKKTGKITNLVDLGCGLNPLTYSLLKNLKKTYCIDINEDEINFLKKYFKENKAYEGEAETLDLTKQENIKKIKQKTQKTDCCFLFKLLDGLESIKKGTSKQLINNIESKTIIISFSKKTISGKNNITSKRTWFKKILEQQEEQGKKTDQTEIGDEEYYFIIK